MNYIFESFVKILIPFGIVFAQNPTRQFCGNFIFVELCGEVVRSTWMGPFGGVKLRVTKFEISKLVGI